MSSYREKSRRIALCGILAALALVFLCLGGILPFAAYCGPILALLCAIPVMEEYGAKMTLVFYAAVSLLALLISPNPESALLFLFLGYYPALRPTLERAIRPRWLCTVVKLLIGLGSVCAMYGLFVSVLGLLELEETYTAAMLAILLVLGSAVWLMVDILLQRFTHLYRKKLRGKIFRG